MVKPLECEASAKCTMTSQSNYDKIDSIIAGLLVSVVERLFACHHSRRCTFSIRQKNVLIRNLDGSVENGSSTAGTNPHQEGESEISLFHLFNGIAVVG